MYNMILVEITIVTVRTENADILRNGESIRSSDYDSTSFWPPGSLHALGADGHI